MMKKLKLTKQKLRELFRSKSFIDFVLHEEDALNTSEVVQWLHAEYLMSFDKDFLNDFKSIEKIGREFGYEIVNNLWLDLEICKYEQSELKNKEDTKC